MVRPWVSTSPLPCLFVHHLVAGGLLAQKLLETAGELLKTFKRGVEAARTAFDSGVHITAGIALVLMAGAAVLAAVVLRKVPTAG